jgi:hypothetical protein
VSEIIVSYPAKLELRGRMHATTPEAAAIQAAALKAALQEVTDAVEKYTKVSLQHAGAADLERLGEVSELEINMLVKSRNLDRVVRGPVTMMFAHFENVSTFFIGFLQAGRLIALSHRRSSPPVLG